MKRSITVHLNVIHGEEKCVLHPSVFARLGSVGNNVDLCTGDAINMNSKMKWKLVLLKAFQKLTITTRHRFATAWVVGEVKVAHVHVEVGSNKDWNAPVV